MTEARPARQVVLDTETTGLEVDLGHRIIEIGCVELRSRRVTGRNFHHYVNPKRAIDAGAQQVHGISSEMLADKPVIDDIIDDFIEYVRGAELLIHNADFDVGFLDAELAACGRSERMAELCTVTDTLAMARKKRPGRKNKLDVLCSEYGVDNSNRELHGALLDALLLAEVYLAMTGGQSALSFGEAGGNSHWQSPELTALLEQAEGKSIMVVEPTEAEETAHAARLDAIRQSAGAVLWDAGEATG